MKSPLQRRTALVAALLAPALAACGFSAQTDQVYQPAVGVNDRSGAVDILNAVIVSESDGSGTFAGSLADGAGKDAQLVSVTGDGVTATGLPLDIAANQLVNLSRPDADGKAQLVITGSDVKPGFFVRLTLAFASGQATTVNVPVVSNGSQDAQEYSDVPVPSDEPTDEATKTPGKKNTQAPADEPTDGATAAE